MKYNFSFPSYADALSAAIKDVAARKIDLGRRHIIIVPDRCTLTAERALCAATGGAFDAYVTTWSRLLPAGGGYLPKKGSVMLVRRILAERRDELKCYQKSWSSKGFASRMYDAISQLRVCGIAPEEIIKENDGGKSHDIALVYSDYLAQTEGRLTDASGRMILLARELENGDALSNAVVYIACFDAYTELMKRVIDVIERKALELRVYDTAADYGTFGSVLLYGAPSPAAAAKAIAARIAGDRIAGVSYDDICVVTSAQRPDELTRIFRENGIPYCAPESLTLAEHRLGCFIAGAVNASARGYRPDDIISLAKNPFSGVDKADCDALERFVRGKGITYKLFLSPFTVGSGACEEYRERAEAGRAKIAELLSVTAAEGSAADMLDALIDYAEENYAPDLAEADDGRASPFVKARELTDLCRRLLDGAPDRIVTDAFCEGMRETELAARPRLRGAVEIGGERDFRARRFSRVYVADFDMSEHPAVTSDNGLIGDDEINELRALGRPLSPTTAEVNKRAADEFFLLLSGAEKVMLVYTDKPGDMLDVIDRATPGEIERGGWEKDNAELERSADPLDLARACPTPQMMEEQYLAACSLVRDGFGEPAWMNYAKALSPSAVRLMPEPAAVSRTAGKLMRTSNTSDSRLEAYFKCPRLHFFRYGLRLSKIEEARMSALDVGSVLHRVAEKYIAVMDKEPPEKAAERLLAAALAETGKADADVNKKLVTLLRKEAARMCRGIYDQVHTGKFVPKATELHFGGSGDRCGGVVLRGGRDGVTLGGKIDRVDVCGDLARVIDYKTGTNVTSNIKEVRMGLDLQLPLYMAVVRGAGYRLAGAFYMPTRSDFNVKSPYLLVGFCDNSDEVLSAMDPNITAAGESSVVRLGGRQKRKYAGHGETAASLNAVTDYAVATAAGAVAETEDGYIAPSPIGNACGHCEYAACCGYEGGGRKLRSAKLSFGNGGDKNGI